MTTGGAVSLSSSVKLRPSTMRIPSAAKAPALTRRGDAWAVVTPFVLLSVNAAVDPPAVTGNSDVNATLVAWVINVARSRMVRTSSWRLSGEYTDPGRDTRAVRIPDGS